jgi:release factor glutamine methyltransferase
MTEIQPRGLEVVAQVDGLSAHETQRLLLAATGWTRDQLYAGRRVDEAGLAALDRLVARRRAGEPLQYIEGTCEFGPLTLRCDPRALIPRPETEQLWELVVGAVGEPPHVVVDLGTGSGNLALACKYAWPEAEVYATELSADALALAAENVVLTGLDVTLLCGDLLAPLPDRLRGAVDLIVSNPPYLAAGELAEVPAEVRDYEPAAALVAGESGLEVLVRIAANVPRWLKPGGMVACEVSEFHGEAVAALFAGFGGEVVSDLVGKDRFVMGRMPGHDVG